MAKGNISFGMETGANLANTALGQLGSTFFGRIHDQRQLEQQKKLNKLQIAGNKEMSDYERMQSMKMWNDTNYGAQIKHAKDAGMSISALYGGSGGGGATTGGGGGAGVTGGIAPDGNSSTGMGLQMASQLALMEAQKENIEADTANKKAGAEVAGSERSLKDAQTLTEGEKFTKTAAESQLANRSLEDNIAEQKANRIGAEIENEAKKVGIRVDEGKIKQMAEQIKQGWKGLDQGERKLKIEAFSNEIKANYPGVWNVAGKYVNDFVDALNNMIGQKDYEKHKIK